MQEESRINFPKITGKRNRFWIFYSFVGLLCFEEKFEQIELSKTQRK